MTSFWDIILPDNPDANRRYLENHKLNQELRTEFNENLGTKHRVIKILVGIYLHIWLFVGVSCFAIIPFIIWIPLSIPHIIYWIQKGRSLTDDLNERYNIF